MSSILKIDLEKKSALSSKVGAWLGVRVLATDTVRDEMGQMAIETHGRAQNLLVLASLPVGYWQVWQEQVHGQKQKVVVADSSTRLLAYYYSTSC